MGDYVVKDSTDGGITDKQVRIMIFVSIGKAVLYGKSAAVKLAKETGRKSYISYYLDIVRCSFMGVSPDRFVADKVYDMTEPERKKYCETRRETLKSIREWVKLKKNIPVILFFHT